MNEVYRAYDTDGTLLYIGVTLNLKQRISAHRSKSDWCHDDVVFVGKPAGGRGQAELLEARAIRRFRPPHNKRVTECGRGMRLDVGEYMKRAACEVERLLETYSEEELYAMLPSVEPREEALKLADLDMPVTLPKPKKRKAK